MMSIHLALVEYTYMEWIYAKISDISIMCELGKFKALMACI